MIYKVEYSCFIAEVRCINFFCISADDVGDAYEKAKVKLSGYSDSIILLVSPYSDVQLEFDFYD